MQQLQFEVDLLHLRFVSVHEKEMNAFTNLFNKAKRISIQGMLIYSEEIVNTLLQRIAESTCIEVLEFPHGCRFVGGTR